MLRLMTYNLGIDAEINLDLTTRIIKHVAPNILVLNEIPLNGVKQNAIQVLSVKISLTNFYLAKSANSNNHTALFSSYELKNERVLPGFYNSGVLSTLRTDIGELSIAGIHLAPDSEDTRLAEIRTVIEEQRPQKNKIIVGDLNSISPENTAESRNHSGDLIKDKTRYDVIQFLKESGYSDAAIATHKEKIPTVPVTQDADVTFYNLRLDYIFISDTLISQLARYSVLVNEDTKANSDHFPVVVDIR